MGRFWDSSWGMICAGFLSPVYRADLTALAQVGSGAHRLARRANALVLSIRAGVAKRSPGPCCWSTTRSAGGTACSSRMASVSYTHLRAHETDSYLVCRLLLEKKKTTKK